MSANKTRATDASVEAFIDEGPDTGTKAWGEVILAGTDRVAIDAVGLIDRITPFITPTYSSSVPKSVNKVITDIAKTRFQCSGVRFQSATHKS